MLSAFRSFSLKVKMPFEMGRKMKWKNGIAWKWLKSLAALLQKRGGQTTIHQTYEKKNKVFSQFFLLFFFSSFTYLFNHVFPFSQQTKKERTHKTPIHKIKPIPSLSWANCLLEVCCECFVCGHEDRLYFFSRFAVQRSAASHVLQETVFILYHPLL